MYNACFIKIYLYYYVLYILYLLTTLPELTVSRHLKQIIALVL